MSEKTEGYTLRDERNAFMQERDELLAELHRLDQRLCKASGHWLSRDKMIDALASERDEAVRVAGELRAALEAAAEKFMRITWIALPRTMIMARAQDGWQEAQDALDSLTASTGGSSDEPQKEIRE